MRRFGINLVMVIFFMATAAVSVFAADPYGQARKQMVQVIKSNVSLTRQDLKRPALDPKVINAMATVPRHLFVPRARRPYAYENRPLPIGHGQTISQPYMVAVMTDLLTPKPQDRILEVGTGSGYQAAILSMLVKKVYTIEIIKHLGENALRRFKELGYENVQTRIGDGYYGWKAQAPFDAIVVTAAASHIPPPLLEQLKPGGRMVIPVGSRFLVQQLLVVEKDINGDVTTRQVLPVAFVPLTGGH